MIIARSVNELRSCLRPASSVGFVPTMGALHAGHVKLIESSASQCEQTVVSLFVNPTQFAPNEDLGKYPRDFEADRALCEAAGVGILFAPESNEMYGGSSTSIDVGPVATRWEGAHRPGHFAGVATVVAKLFGIVGPCDAFFGMKDLQQCAVVRQLVHDLFLPVTLYFIETIREHDGLAMSSRNRYFTSEQRQEVVELPNVLRRTCEQLGLSRGGDVGAVVRQGITDLDDSGWQVDYLSCVNANTMIEDVIPTEQSRCIVAAKKYGVRLIDNMPIFG